MATDNREKSRRIFEKVWNEKQVEQIDELVAPEYVHHDVLSPDQTGIKAYKLSTTTRSPIFALTLKMRFRMATG